MIITKQCSELPRSTEFYLHEPTEFQTRLPLVYVQYIEYNKREIWRPIRAMLCSPYGPLATTDLGLPT
jgi:hypothetical protein